MSEFRLILRGDPDAWRHRPPEQARQLISQSRGWAGRLMGERRFLDGKKRGAVWHQRELSIDGSVAIRRLDPMG